MMKHQFYCPATMMTRNRNCNYIDEVLTYFHFDKCRYFSVVTLIFLCVFSPSPSWGTESFPQGIAAYQDKDFAKAKELLEKSLTEGADPVAVHTNLGLVYFQLGEKNLSLAHLRKAKSLDPRSSTTHQAISYLKSQGIGSGGAEVKEGPFAISRTIPEIVVSILSPVFLLLAGWTWIQYLSRKRKSVDGEKVSVPRKSVLFAFLWIVFVALQGLQFIDSQTMRATVLPPTTPARSAPEDSAPNLFDLNGGDEIEISNHQSEWSQIINAQGDYGWVKNSDLFINSRKEN